MNTKHAILIDCLKSGGDLGGNTVLTLAEEMFKGENAPDNTDPISLIIYNAVRNWDGEDENIMEIENDLQYAISQLNAAIIALPKSTA